ncbi:MAG: AI-2E family transporter [Chloroflexota bacterium]
MPNQSLYRFAAFIVAMAALFIVMERLWGIALLLQDIILLFALAWLVSFTLAPVVEWLKRPVYPQPLYRRFRARIAPLAQRRFLPHGAAVALVYLAMLALVMIGVGSVTPVAIRQTQNVSQVLPQLPTRLPQLFSEWEQQLAGFGLQVNLRDLYQANLEPQLNQIGVNAARELLNGFSAVAATVSNLLLVLILSLYMSLGGSTLVNQFAELIPQQFKREMTIFVGNVNKNFGGFIRGQLLQSLLVGIVTALVMLVLRLDFVVLGAILAGLFMLIPLIGVFLSIAPPVLIALFVGSVPTALIVFALLFVFQQILMNALMPKIMADSVGLHPLLVFAALLIGVRVGGIWGAFFGIPIAGVLYAMLLFFVGRMRRLSEERARAAKAD